MSKICIVDCSEKNTQHIEIIINIFTHFFNSHNIETLVVPISSLRVVSCTDCKVCMQVPGIDPAKCFHRDGMDDIIDVIENSDAYVFLSDTNSMFSANEILQKFSKRLAGYYYWPYGSKCSINRKNIYDKSSILINYNASKGIIKKSHSEALKQLKTNSMAIGAEPVATLSFKSTKKLDKFTNKYKIIIESSAKKLIKSL